MREHCAFYIDHASAHMLCSSVCAVEHAKNIQVDSRREYQIFKLSANTAHPLSRFGTGNLQTLEKPHIVDALLAFHRRWYSANIMRLAVVGRGASGRVHPATGVLTVCFSRSLRVAG